MDGAQPTSSSSLRRNPAGNRRKTAGPGENRPQPRAEFRGKGRDAYYTPYHGSYSPYTCHPDWDNMKDRRLSTRSQPYAVREEIPWVESPVSGPVTGFDKSVRARNMPILFIKQMKDRALFIKTDKGYPFYAKVYDLCFKDYGDFYVEAKNRPKIGCIPTFNWNDEQVSAWSKLAKHIGVQYSGKREYSFPKGCLGEMSHGRSYSTRKPWPRFSDPDDKGREIFPFFETPRRRSDTSRQYRSLRRKVKQATVKPLDFTSLLVQRKVETRAQIKQLWWNSDRRMSFREFRDSRPNCLSLNTKKPLQVSRIVMDSLMKLGSRVSKFIPDLPWIKPKKLEYKIQFHQPLNRERAGRLNVWVSIDKNIYVNHGNISNIHIISDPKLREHVRKKVEDLQSMVDYDEDHNDGYRGPATLGRWDSDSPESD
jgi:hypothetical protein